jgi:predicted nucleotidyltransferase
VPRLTPGQILSDATLATLLRELRAGLHELYGLQLSSLILYGSYSRGTAHQGSDLDMAVVLDGFERTWPEIERTGPLVACLSEKFGITVSLIPVRKRDWDSRRTLLGRSLRREGRPIA